MPFVPESKKPAISGRRPLRGRRNAPAPEPQNRGPLYFQVHFQPVPGARKALFVALRPQLGDLQQEMIQRGQLLFSGGYPTSIGGMWLLKADNRAEAEKLVLAHPAVERQLLTWRLLELQEPQGAILAAEPASPPPTLES
jgi:hypothetical protein